MVANVSLEALLEPVVEIARRAGQAVQTIYESGDFRTTYKADKSPLTRADLAANDIIVKALAGLTPTVPIVSEESLDIVPADRMKYSMIWLVDPLDGTKEFIDETDNFTVNIGLVRAGRPVLGAVYAPAHELLYYGAAGLGTWKQLGGKQPEKIVVAGRGRRPIVAVSRSHQNAATRKFLQALGEHDELALGSSLKLCYVADGTADIYPRLSPSMEWDTAAADAVVRAAGGQVLDFASRRPLRYNKADLHNPSFIVQTGDGKLKQS